MVLIREYLTSNGLCWPIKNGLNWVGHKTAYFGPLAARIAPLLWGKKGAVIRPGLAVVRGGDPEDAFGEIDYGDRKKWGKWQRQTCCCRCASIAWSTEEPLSR